LAHARRSGKMVDDMEAEVHQRTAGEGPWLLTTWRSSRFSIDEARRALPYLARVIRDASAAYREAQFARREILHRSGAASGFALHEQRDAAIRRLNSAIDECNAVGADLLDLDHGLVRFGAELAGRPVSLFWQLDDPLNERCERWPGAIMPPAGTIPGR
jgi:hypothetical protein